MARATAVVLVVRTILLVGKGHPGRNGSSAHTQRRQGPSTRVRTSPAATAMAVAAATTVTGTVSVTTGAVGAIVIVIVRVGPPRPAVTAVVIASPRCGLHGNSTQSTSPNVRANATKPIRDLVATFPASVTDQLCSTNANHGTFSQVSSMMRVFLAV